MASQLAISTSTAIRTEPTIGTVCSKDGATVGYRTIGRGPGIVVVHGAMETADSHRELAEALADRFAVHLVDRRGRGLSGPFAPDHSIARDVEDVAAVAEATGSRFVFGVSSGGVIALQAGLALPWLERVAVYEPALVEDPSAVAGKVARYERQMAAGKVADALVSAMQVTEMGPAIFRLLPARLLAALTGSMLAKQDRAAAPGEPTMRRLAPTLHCDFAVALDASRRVGDFRGIEADVLLLGGSKSPRYLRRALDVLERTVPNARRVELAGLDHNASGNREWRGTPDVVAAELARFFA